MSDTPAPGQGSSTDQSKTQRIPGKTCRMCGCNLTYVPEPVICPQCGAIHRDSQSPSARTTLEKRLIWLNSVAFLLALFIIILPRRGGFGWFPFSGPSCFVCIVIPLQIVVAFWAFFAYVARDEIGPVRRWLWVGAIAPFVLGVLSLLAVKYF
jgi:hypothetical protein